MSKNTPIKPERPADKEVSSTDLLSVEDPLIGKKVLITNGAWKGENGLITSEKLPNEAYRITTDGGIGLAWFRDEFDILG